MRAAQASPSMRHWICCPLSLRKSVFRPSMPARKMTVHFGADVNLAGGVHFTSGSQADTLNLLGLPTNSPFSLLGSGQGSLTIGGTDGMDDIHSDVTILAPVTLTANDQPDPLP